MRCFFAYKDISQEENIYCIWTEPCYAHRAGRTAGLADGI